MSTKKVKPVGTTPANPSQPVSSPNEAGTNSDVLSSPQSSLSDAPAANDANTSPSAPSVPETVNDTAKEGNAPETGASDGQAPNDQLQDALESFAGNSFLDLLRTIEANTEDPDEKAAAAELIEWLEAHPNDEDFMANQALKVLLYQMTEQRKTVLVLPPVNLEAVIDATVESPLPESDEDRAARIMAKAEAELNELKEASRQRGEAAEAQREAAGAEAQADRRNK